MTSCRRGRSRPAREYTSPKVNSTTKRLLVIALTYIKGRLL
ncbi:hypothetical protein OG946_16840 [Streptomyces sp. NBC_01808]|nr:hypothetical protein [Streptomyces sp. NBC_01808]WSA38891.1 hypothetical protein OG946_16840 [Streptomyces sp. NBC_01808]